MVISSLLIFIVDYPAYLKKVPRDKTAGRGFVELYRFNGRCGGIITKDTSNT
jgi:hypothetical protein